tara:strand:- start:506 stop:1360 length:855 start_codon:yes stop_codon:yes gene_type:complete
MSKKNYNLFIYFLIILIILFILFSVYLYYSNLNLKKKINIEKNNKISINKFYLEKKKYNNNIKSELNKINNKNNLKIDEINEIKLKYTNLEHKFNKINNELNIHKNHNSDKICMSLKQLNQIKNNNNNNNNNNNYKTTRSDTIVRDYRVLNDELFPPINRSDTNNHTELTNNIINRSMYIKTNNVNDTFRLVGYVTNNSEEKDTGNNNWKLFARQKDRHSSEFYMTPTNNNNDVKISITDDIILGNKLRDMYAIPNIISFNSPMLNTSPYQVVEIPRNDFIYNP